MIRKAALLTLLAALLAPTGMAGTAVAAPAERVVPARDQARDHKQGGARSPATPNARHTATTPADPLQLTAITPEIPREPDTPITISATATGAPMSTVRVRIHYTPGRPFASRADLERFVTGAGYPTTRYSTKIYGVPLSAAGKLPVTFTVTPRELGMSQPGAYPLAIELLNAVNDQPIAIKRTVVPYAPKGERIGTVKLALALPVVDRPHRADDATFMDDELAASVSSGRLAALLKLVQTTDSTVTWFVDAALLEEVRRTSTERYSVKTNSGLRTQEADRFSGQWLTALRTALADRPVLAMPYTDPDLTALVHHGLSGPAVASIQRGAAAASELLSRDIRVSTVWPVRGRIDRDTIDELAMAGVESVLLSGDALPTSLPGQRAEQLPASPPATGMPASPPTGQLDGISPVTPEPAVRLDTVAETPLTVLLADPVLSELLTSATPPADAVLARQRFLGETAMIAVERAEQAQRTGRSTRPVTTTVIAAPEAHQWDPDPAFVSDLLRAVAAAPWVRLTSLDTVRPGPRAEPRSDLVYTDRDRNAELSRSYLGMVRRLADKADAAATITAEHSPLFHEAILRLTAAAWRGDGRRAQTFVAQVEAAIDARISQVSVIDTPRAVAGTDGQVPVSVANHLDKNVELKIQVTSDAPSRLAVVGGVYEEDVTVLQNRTQLVNVPVTVPGGGGEATIAVQLFTDQGKPYGKAVHITVRATDYTGIASVIVGSALSIMLAAMVLRLLRRRSKKTPPASPADSGTDREPGGEPSAGPDPAPAGRVERAEPPQA